MSVHLFRFIIAMQRWLANKLYCKNRYYYTFFFVNICARTSCLIKQSKRTKNRERKEKPMSSSVLQSKFNTKKLYTYIFVVARKFIYLAL